MNTCPLMVAHEGDSGEFIVWLESLGLKDLLQKYPLAKLVEWGWIEPAYRLVVPLENLDFSDPGETNFQSNHETTPYKSLWFSEWQFEPDVGEQWFLHPNVRRADTAAQLLRAQPQPARSINLPEPIMEQSGVKFLRYADFYYHWQAYALLDVFRWADTIHPILNTPDAVKTAESISRIVAHQKIDGWDPTWVLSSEKRWPKWGKLLTMLSHYRGLTEKLDWREIRNEKRDKDLRIRAGKALARHFSIDAHNLETLIREDLLVLANDRFKPQPFNVDWQQMWWHELQNDVLLSVQWLCQLNGNTVYDYLIRWSDPPHLQREAAAELADVLPFSFFQDRREFLRMVPFYLKIYNSLASDAQKFEGKKLAENVDAALTHNAAFDAVVFAFGELHRALTWDSKHKGIQFKERRALDYYRFLGSRVEQALSDHVSKIPELAGLTLDYLGDLIIACAKLQNISPRVIAEFKGKHRQITKLHDKPKDPIGLIEHIATELKGLDRYLLQSFLCACLARNYFAHHSYHDEHLMHSKQSEFLLSGVLVTLLTLLRPAEAAS